MHLERKINEIIDMRLTDIAIAKKCITRAKGEIERTRLKQSAIITIYASLEGGFRDLTKTLLEEIDGSPIKYSDLHQNYATLALSRVCRLDKEVKDTEKQIIATAEIIRTITSPPTLPKAIDLESNLTPRVIKKISASLRLNRIIKSQSEENDLNILLRFRNNIAHGDRRMPIEIERIDQTSSIAVKIITNTAHAVSEAYKKTVWLAATPES